jgi:DtxR family Mn-dependent transcriptional regulator
MDALLGYPKFDPHGSPIPDKNGKMEWISYQMLTHCSVGDVVNLAAVTNSSAEFLKFLNARELKLGTRLRIVAVESFDKSMTISYDGRCDEVLSALVCEKLLVTL